MVNKKHINSLIDATILKNYLVSFWAVVILVLLSIRNFKK
jgi:hypothetical protein